MTLRNSISKPFVTRPPFHQYQGGRTTKKVTPKTPTVPTATKEKPRLTTKSHTKPGGKSSEELKIYSTLHSETSEKTVAILPTTGGTKSNVMDSSKETASKLTSTKIIASSFTTEHMLVPEKTTDYTKYGKLESENSETAKSLSDDLTAATTEIENNTDKLKMTNNKPQLTTSYARNVEKLQKEVKSDATGTYHSTTPSQSIRVSITDRQELTVSVSHKKQGKTTEKSDLQNATSEEPSVEIKSVSQKTAVKYSEKLFIKETTTSNLDETAENKKYQKATRTTNCSAGTQSPVPKNEVTKETTTLSWYVTDKIDKMTPLLRTKGTDSGHIDDQLESSQSPTRANKELETTVNEFTPVKTTFDDRHETTEKSHSNTADTLGLFDDLSTTRSFTGHQIDHSETSEFQSSILLPQTKAEMPQISSSPKPKVPQATEDTGKLENNSESFATKIYPITKSKESGETFFKREN